MNFTVQRFLRHLTNCGQRGRSLILLTQQLLVNTIHNARNVLSLMKFKTKFYREISI
jgi:hypothetical protein